MNLLKFSQNLKASLAENNLTQQAFASKMGTTQATVNRWIKGVNEPDFAALLQMCLLLDETPNALLGYDEIPKEVLGSYRRT